MRVYKKYSDWFFTILPRLYWASDRMFVIHWCRCAIVLRSKS